MAARFKHAPVPLPQAPFQRLWLLLACALAAACNGGDGSVDARPGADHSTGAPSAAAPRCAVASPLLPDQRMVTSWRTAPTDALITHPISGLTVRQFVAPHWGGGLLQLRLSNRYSSLPVTLEDVHVAQEVTPGSADLVPGSECLLSFEGRSRITIPPGGTVVSDRIVFPVRAFKRLGISFFAPDATVQVTRHLSANEILFLSIPGNYSADPGGARFLPVPDSYASNFLVIEALEVAAPRQVATVVIAGDSITDGSGSTTQALQLSASPMTSTDQRYPNHLQRRIDQAGLPLSVANAGIGGNELLGDGWLPQFGLSLLKRFNHDVLAVTAASHVLVMIGTNDFGNPKTTQPPSTADMIAGYTVLIDLAHAAGKRIILGTIPPAEGAVTEGLPVVGSALAGVGLLHGTAAARQSRDAINAWIREQTLSDGVVDFAACLEDPDRPGYLAPDYNSGDNLHPSPAGYAAMAQCIDLDLFRNAGSRP